MKKKISLDPYSYQQCKHDSEPGHNVGTVCRPESGNPQCQWIKELFMISCSPLGGWISSHFAELTPVAGLAGSNWGLKSSVPQIWGIVLWPQACEGQDNLNINDPHNVIYLDDCFPVGGAVWKGRKCGLLWRSVPGGCFWGFKNLLPFQLALSLPCACRSDRRFQPPM